MVAWQDHLGGNNGIQSLQGTVLDAAVLFMWI
jgi:hypothetical protein